MEIWFREDVARILAATLASMRGTLGAVEEAGGWRAEAYERGFGDAVRAVGIAFGVVEPWGREGVCERGGRWCVGAVRPLGYPRDGEPPVLVVERSEENLERR